jgi:hypothetical protein
MATNKIRYGKWRKRKLHDAALYVEVYLPSGPIAIVLANEHCKEYAALITCAPKLFNLIERVYSYSRFNPNFDASLREKLYTIINKVKGTKDE